MSRLTLTPARAAVLWTAMWTEMDHLNDHPDNAKYRTGREEILAKMRGLRDMLRELNAAEPQVTQATLEEILAEYIFETPYTLVA